ncbi:hypothetical protein [Candidatus Ichthyocystis hellenicum]|uniref:hypothetical protein n=2 Tax=Candidatus Ichthyocystis TaxID=2929841 RepID=UPI000B888905|nr:hypothetical protein [Candidatus Ichthyocystis hellenicum]
MSSSKVIPSNYSNSEIDEPQHKYITKDKATASNANNTELQKVENLTQVTKSDGPAKKSNFWKDTALPIVMDICFPPSFPREARSPLTLIILIAFTILFSYIYPGPGCTSAYRRRR